VRREYEKFQRMQIWIQDKKIGKLADEQWDRMGELFHTNSIPLHAIVEADGSKNGRVLARFEYSPTATEEDYLAFLRAGLAAFK
jgi:hypothetical protein